MDVHLSLTRLMETVAENNLTVEYDDDWPSICVDSENPSHGDTVVWSPKYQVPRQEFDNVEHALEIKMHQDIKDYYTLYWSDSIIANAQQGQCELIQPWNEEDFQRLQENLIGHVLTKRRLQQPITWFFGLTDEEDYILSIENESGRVVLEQIGCIPKKVIADNLSQFIHDLCVI